LIVLESKRIEQKYCILNALKDSDLCIEDIEMYTNLNRLDIVPIVQDLVHYHDIEENGTEIYYYTNRKRKIYSITSKGAKKLNYLEKKYSLKQS